MREISAAVNRHMHTEFVVLDKDILAVPTDEIKDIKVVATYFGGKLWQLISVVGDGSLPR